MLAKAEKPAKRRLAYAPSGSPVEDKMADIEKVKACIAEIAGRRKNVTAEEIDRVVNQIKQLGFSVRPPRKTSHSTVYFVGSNRFSVCTHHKGSKQIKPCYVDQFVDAMIELGLYED